jgi:uncharacterized membrane protein YvlD (DUF360 family)
MTMVPTGTRLLNDICHQLLDPPTPLRPTDLQDHRGGEMSEPSPNMTTEEPSRSSFTPTVGRNPFDESTRFFTDTAPRPTLIAMRQILLRAVVLLGSWAIGLLVAAWVVPGVSLSLSGFIVAVVVFSVVQAILSLLILKLPHGYASLLLGGTGLALTIVALSLASVLTHGLSIRGIASWVAATVVVWLVTTVGAISLPELFARDEAGST